MCFEGKDHKSSFHYFVLNLKAISIKKKISLVKKGASQLCRPAKISTIFVKKRTHVQQKEFMPASDSV